jgi:sugar lactone lactonase YvrE
MNRNRSRRSRASLALACVVLSALVVVGAAAAAPTKVVLDGLFNPRGIAVNSLGALAVAEQGAGEVNLYPLGLKYNLAMLPSEGETGPVDVAFSGLGLGFLGDAYIVMSGGVGPLYAKLLRVGPVSGVKVVADIGAYQVTDPDPDDQDDFPEESNPNGLAILGHGNVLVADAAANDLLHVSKDGTISTVARFPREEVAPGVLAEAVPTSVAVGPDGGWYVSELTGFPFVPGSAKIYRIEPGTTEATCPSAACTVYASGFTNIIDLAFGSDGTMYVLEISKNGLLSDNPVGALWAVQGGTKTELAPGELLFPGGVAVGRHNTLYVTTGAVFGEGAGTVVKVSTS